MKILKGFRTILGIVLSIVLITTFFSQGVYAIIPGEDTVINNGYESKITDRLKTIIANADTDTKIPIYIFRKEVTEQELNALMLSKYNINTYSVEGIDLISTFSSNSDISYAAEINEYVIAKRDVLKQEYKIRNNEFVIQNISNHSDIKYCGQYTSTIVVDATIDQIYEYALLDDVQEIDYYEELTIEPAVDIASTQVGADRTSGTKSSNYNAGSGWTGNGIKIGIIEAESAKYDSTAPQLSGIHNVRLFYVDNIKSDGTTVPSEVKPHATMVTSLIVGQSYTYNGHTYEGIAPGATVYQTSCVYPSDVYTAFSVLANYGVSVINYSASSETTTYTAMDKEIDRLIAATGITFVCAAGNNSGNTRSPARAINTLAVGNLNTKTSSTTALSAPYAVYDSSSYIDVSYLPNKPDVVAPGRYVSYAKSSSVITTSSGTSVSAPIVTGLVAQAMQMYPSLKTSPYAVKSVMALIADYSCVSASNGNSSVGNYLYEKSGAGLVNAKMIGRSYISVLNTINSISSSKTIGSRTYTAGQKIRAVLCFGKNNDVGITSSSKMDNLNIELVNSSTGAVIYSSNSTNNNIEIIECTIPSNGTYYFRVRAVAIQNTTNGVPFSISWRIE